MWLLKKQIHGYDGQCVVAARFIVPTFYETFSFSFCNAIHAILLSGNSLNAVGEQLHTTLLYLIYMLIHIKRGLQVSSGTAR
jgi:hypothetical protein